MSQSSTTERAQPSDLLTQYELLQRLGGSERASVHRARDRVLGQVVAIKLLREERGHDPDRVARYYRLARAAANLGHPNIVATYDHGSAWRSAFITMEYVAGRDLATLLDQQGALPPRRAAAIVAQILDALTVAYGAGLIHGDLHPHNVLLRDSTDAVVLTDFGMAALRTPVSGRVRDADMNAAYRAPELALGAPTSPAADIYAAGALLHAALTAPDGNHGAAPGQQTDLSTALLEVAHRALAPNPAARYPSAAAMRDDLIALAGPFTRPTAALSAPTQGTAHLPRPATRRARFPRSVRQVATALLIAILLASILTGTTALVRAARSQGDPMPTATVAIPAAATPEPTATTAPPSPTPPRPTATTPAATATAAPSPAIPAVNPATPVPAIPTSAPTPAATATTQSAPTATTEPIAEPTAPPEPTVAPTKPTATPRPVAPVAPAPTSTPKPTLTVAPTPTQAPTPTPLPPSAPATRTFGPLPPLIEYTPTVPPSSAP